ncbi:MAG: flavin-dependent monooxygenase [Novosphingobium sp.]
MPDEHDPEGSTISQTGDKSDALEAFCALVRKRREEIEALGQLPSDIVLSLKELGIYRSLVPKTLGGNEISPSEFLRLIERISAADGAVGWVSSFAGAVVYLAGLPQHRFEEFYVGGPDVAFAAGLYPVQPVRRKGDKLILNGRWKFASGCTGADWLGVGITVGEDNRSGKPRVIIFPRERAELIDDWNVVGLAGTGSFDLVLENVEVEEDWSFVRGGKTTRKEPIYGFPIIAFSALNHAIVSIGVAMDALAEAKSFCRQNPNTPQLARATARLSSARAFVFHQTDRVWEMVRRSMPVPSQEQVLLRLAGSFASEAATAACRTALYSVDQGDAPMAYRNIARHLRDALVVGQHAFLSPATYEQAGRFMIDDVVEPGFI